MFEQVKKAQSWRIEIKSGGDLVAGWIEIDMAERLK